MMRPMLEQMQAVAADPHYTVAAAHAHQPGGQAAAQTPTTPVVPSNSEQTSTNTTAQPAPAKADKKAKNADLDLD